MELRGGLCWSCWPNNQWTAGRTPSHNQNFFVTGSLRMETSWSDLLRNPCSVNCHASHACEATSQSARGRYVVKAASQCACAYLDRSLAMCLLKPSSLPQCVLAYPMCLRNAILAYISKVSSQCVCATQCVFTMRLGLPMRLRVPMRQCVSASQCVCAY